MCSQSVRLCEVCSEILIFRKNPYLCPNKAGAEGSGTSAPNSYSDIHLYLSFKNVDIVLTKCYSNFVRLEEKYEHLHCLLQDVGKLVIKAKTSKY